MSRVTFSPSEEISNQRPVRGPMTTLSAQNSSLMRLFPGAVLYGYEALLQSLRWLAGQTHTATFHFLLATTATAFESPSLAAGRGIWWPVR